MNLKRTVLMGLVAAVALSGCRQTAPPAPPPTEPPLPGSLKTVVIPIAEDPPGFNAYLTDSSYEELLGELVYEGLAEMAPDGTFYPKLAAELPTRQNGGIAPDGLTVTWKLRNHILWSDGQPFTSDDVLFTWQALSHPENGLAQATGFDLIDSVEVPDAYTVVLHYRQPYPNVWGQFGGRGLGIFPRHACGSTAWMAGWACNTQPVGTGPFVLQLWDEGKQLIFARNPHYWQTGRPFLDRLIFPIVSSDKTRSDLLRDGDAHINLWLTPDQIDELQDVEGVRLVSMPNRWLLRLVFNLTQPPEQAKKSQGKGTPTPQPEATPANAETAPASPRPHFALADPRVRQAIDMAIDRQRLIKEAFDGQGTAASSEFYHGWAVCPGAAETAYNPEAARALLAQAGWQDLNGDHVLEAYDVPGVPDGTKFQLTMNTYDGWDALANAQKLIVQMLREVDIRVTPELAGQQDLWGNWQDGGLEAHGQFDADLWDDGYPGTDPTDYLIWRYASWSIPRMEDGGKGGDVMHFANPEVDRLLQQSLTQFDPAARRQTFCQMQRILADERPMLYLVYFSDTYAFSSQLQGQTLNPNDALTWDVINWQLAK
jgi:peptide/nickel transport system substrate-binding protein